MKMKILTSVFFALVSTHVFAYDLNDVKALKDKLKVPSQKQTTSTQQSNQSSQTNLQSVNNVTPADLIGKYALPNDKNGCTSGSDSLLEIEKNNIFYGMESSCQPTKVSGTKGNYTIVQSCASEGEESVQTDTFKLNGNNLSVRGVNYVRCGPSK